MTVILIQSRLPTNRRRSAGDRCNQDRPRNYRGDSNQSPNRWVNHRLMITLSRRLIRNRSDEDAQTPLSSVAVPSLLSGPTTAATATVTAAATGATTAAASSSSASVTAHPSVRQSMAQSAAATPPPQKPPSNASSMIVDDEDIPLSARFASSPPAPPPQLAAIGESLEHSSPAQSVLSRDESPALLLPAQRKRKRITVEEDEEVDRPTRSAAPPATSVVTGSSSAGMRTHSIIGAFTILATHITFVCCGV